MQTTLVPGGIVVIGPRMSSDGSESISMTPLTNLDVDCPQNFSDFISSATASGKAMKPRSTAFAWWARSRIRYSCSTKTATFVRYMVPAYEDNWSHRDSIADNWVQYYSDGRSRNVSLGFSPIKYMLSSWNAHCIFYQVSKSLKLFIHYRNSAHTALIMYWNEMPWEWSHRRYTLGPFLGTMKPYSI